MGWRALLHRIRLFERRWIPRPGEREAHAELVRRRLDSDPSAPTDPSEPPEADPEATESSAAIGGWR